MCPAQKITMHINLKNSQNAIYPLGTLTLKFSHGSILSEMLQYRYAYDITVHNEIIITITLTLK